VNTRQFASRTAAVVVGGIAAVASFTHMRDLAIANGQTHLIGTLMPVSVDGMIAVATLAIADGRTRKGSAWVAFLIGVAASVTANVLAAPDTILARCISGWPAIALLLVVEVLTRGGRPVAVVAAVAAGARIDVKTEPSAPVARPAAKTARAKPAGPSKSTRTAAKVAKAAAVMPGASRTEIAARAGVSEPTARRYLTPPDGPIGVNGAAVLDEVTA
jgi:hypothetical protein